VQFLKGCDVSFILGGAKRYYLKIWKGQFGDFIRGGNCPLMGFFMEGQKHTILKL